ncbi:efflux RND transporter periplasmic adaptor subunit [Accumulibacter sp.]|uniref:efflux RND transporter periplasmic adaptor subunit n=1 Tax=Accumulibacter sp. TaxID=2053492 RepID=UPI002D1F9ADF|nr:efflux RND transporter periplasmic adaptor subunit [Accumulibacter sp.]
MPNDTRPVSLPIAQRIVHRPSGRLASVGRLLFAAGLAAASAAAHGQATNDTLVQVKPVEASLSADAVVEAARQATVAAQVSGRLVEVHVDAGQSVRKGDLLMRIDAREASEAAAAAAASYINARANHERLLRLQRQGFISQAALDKAKAEFDAASATHKQASVGVSHATVRAPIGGVVAERLSELGEMATPGKPLLSIYDPQSLRLSAGIAQHRLPQIRRVRQARIEFPGLGKWLEASSVSLLPSADPSTHVSLVRVGLPEAAREIVPGMHARVHFVLGSAPRLSIPQAAVVRRGEITAVYVRQADGKLTLRQLRLGEAVSENEVEVLAGLHAGERIALDPRQAAVELKSARPTGR